MAWISAVVLVASGSMLTNGCGIAMLIANIKTDGMELLHLPLVFLMMLNLYQAAMWRNLNRQEDARTHY